MDKETRKEIRSRTVKLDSYEQEKQRLERIKSKLTALLSRTHETRLGVRVRLTKRRKVALGKAIVKKELEKDLDIRQDSINQLRIMEA